MVQFLRALFVFFIVSLSLGQLQRLALPHGVHVYVHDVMSMIFVGVVVSRNWRRVVMPELKNYRWEVAALVWTIGVTLLSAVSGQYSLTATLYTARLLLYVGFAYALWRSQILKPAQIRWGYIVCGLLVLFFGLVQYFLVPDVRFLFESGWDDHYYRLVSTPFDPNFTGMILVITLLYLESRRADLSWQVGLGLQSLGVVGLALTYSRASFLGLGVALVLLSWRARAHIPRYVCGALLLILSILVFTPQQQTEGVILTRTASISARGSSLTTIAQSLSSRDWLVGRGMFAPTAPTMTVDKENQPLTNQARFPDNFLLFLVVCLGVPGALLAVGLVLKWTWYVMQQDWHMGVALVATLVHTQFNHTLLQPMVVLFLLGGLVSVQLQLKRPHQK